MRRQTTPLEWRRDWALHRRRTESDQTGTPVAQYDMEHPDFVGCAGTETGVCWQVMSAEWTAQELGETASGGATFDLFLDGLEIAPFDRCIFGGAVWEVRAVLPRSNHRQVELVEMEKL